MIAVPSCHCPDVLKITAAVGFGQTDTGDSLARGHFRQPAFFLRLAAEGDDERRHDVGVHVPRRRRKPGPTQFFDDDGIVKKASLGAAVRLGDAGAQEADLTRAPPDFRWRHALVFPIRIVGNHLGHEELPDGVAE